MEFVGFAMAAVGFVETVLKTWDSIEQRRLENKSAEKLAKNLQLFGLENRRADLKIDLELAQMVMRDRSTPKKDKDRLANGFKQLLDILDSIPEAADTVIANSTPGHFKLLRKSPASKDLKSRVAEFSEASSKFHQLVIGLRDITSNDSSLLLTPQDLTLIGANPEITKVNETSYTARASYAEPGNEAVVKDVLLEPRPYISDESKTDLEKSMRSLATKLNSALAAWNIPRLIGYRSHPTKKVMELVFDRPQPSRELTSLAKTYADDRIEPSLNVRIGLCSQLTVAVLQAHTLGLVHKNIRPENLLIAWLPGEGGEMVGASLFLAGWQNARDIDGQASARIGESIIQKSLYQHPDRRTKGGPAKEGYNIGHDIYSLGVCMLELLTWDPIIRASKDLRRAPVLSDSYQRTFCRLGYGANVTISPDDDITVAELYTQDSKKVQETLVAMSKRDVCQRAGNTMASLVQKCLTCLDPTPSFGDNTFSGSDDKGKITDKFVNEVFDDFNTLLAII